MDVSRLVGLSYLGVAIVAYVVFSKTFEWIWITVDGLQQVAIIGSAFTLTHLLGLVATIILILWMKRHPEIDPFVEDCVKELRKVTWPGLKDTQRNTVLVVAFSVALSMSLWLMDQVWQRVTDYILSFGL
jgi:preprotein translocase subunit SecE